MGSPFKAYDVRGQVGDTLDADLMRRIGTAFAARVAEGTTVVIGQDCRESSPELAEALADGVMAAGYDVLDIGLCGTEEVYFATDHLGAGGGMMVTASHNPPGDNGLKFVRRGAYPVSRDTGLGEVEALAMGDAPLPPGPTFDAIADALTAKGSPLKFTRVDHTPDPSFPKGVPNPLLPQNHPNTSEPLIAAGADFGVAWDGDFDRCFFFDDQGRFVDGVYLVGLLASAALMQEPGASIVYDPRAVLNTEDILAQAGGQAVMAKTGHSLMKVAMREAGAVYGGEMSAHHYFRDFMYCDSGMIPWLMVTQEISRTGQSLAAQVAERQTAYPVSGEINFRVDETDAAIARVLAVYEGTALSRDNRDGVSLRMPGWRFNIRCSNTEPLLRLNVEAEGDADLVAQEVAAISALIEAG